MELYIFLIGIFGQPRVDNFCENVFWRTDLNQTSEVVEICEESVWKKIYFNSYNK